MLFDWLLDWGWRWWGPGAAQRGAVSLAVLVFFWGGWSLMCAAAHRRQTSRPWFLMPLLAMLAYGRVFHFGFFNFYLSLGLVAWAMALAIRGGRLRWAGCAAVAALAWTAHPIPILWGAFATAFLLLSGRLSNRGRYCLTAGAIVAVFLVREALTRRFAATWWTPQQAVCILGADQFWVYSPKYYFVTVVCVLLWVAWLLRLAACRGFRREAADSWLHLCCVHAAGILLIPTSLYMGQFHYRVSFLADRMSLAGALLICALLVAARPKQRELALLAAAAALFFGLLYHDNAAMNRFEDRMAAAVRTLPPGVRVVSGVTASPWRTFAALHTIARACLERCFAYANYEASTAEFRMRVSPGSPLVMASYPEVLDMQMGKYPVRPADLPLWVVRYCGAGPELCVQPLHAGERFGSTGPRLD